MNVSRLALVLAVAVAAAGCGGSSAKNMQELTSGYDAGLATAEDVAVGFDTSVNKGKLEELAQLFPSDTVLRTLISCPSGLGPLEGVRDERARMVGEMASGTRTFRVDSIKLRDSSLRNWELFVDRAREDGCTVSDDMTIRPMIATLIETDQGKTRRQDETLILVKTEKGWFLAGAERYLRVAPATNTP